MNDKVCLNCGNSNWSYANFCAYCGRKFLVRIENERTRQPGRQVETIDRKSKTVRTSVNRRRMAVFSIALFLIMAVTFAFPLDKERVLVRKGEHIASLIRAVGTQVFNSISESFRLEEKCLYVYAEPSADVHLNKAFVGTTPLVLKRTENEACMLVLTHPDYGDTFFSVFSWNEVEQDTISHTFTDLILCSITVQSQSGTAVYIDGEEQGRVSRDSPVVINDLSPGTYEIVLVKWNIYGAWKTEIELKRGEDGEVSHWWRTGRLMVNANPWGMVFIDGRQVDSTPLTIDRIATGNHRLEVRRAGYPDYVRSIYIVEGGTEVVSAR